MSVDDFPAPYDPDYVPCKVRVQRTLQGFQLIIDGALQSTTYTKFQLQGAIHSAIMGELS